MKAIEKIKEAKIIKPGRKIKDYAGILELTKGMTRRELEAFCVKYKEMTGQSIGKSTLYNIRKKMPAVSGRKETVKPEWLELFKNFYLIEGGGSVISCWRLVIGELTRQGFTDFDNFPSPRSFSRALDRTVSREAQYFARKGRDAWYKLYSPYLERDLSKVNPGDVWFSDHHQLDLLCIDDSGETFFPWLTVWSDWKSGKWLGWFLHREPPCSDQIFQAFFYAAEKNGIPRVVYMDNGKDYRCFDFGGGKKKHKLQIDERKACSLTIQLGIEARFALPYNGRTKPIERDFREIKDNFNRHLIGYRGGHVRERPERLKQEIKNMTIQHIEDVAASLTDYIEHVFNELPVNGKYLRGVSRADYWKMHRKEERRVSIDALKLFCMRTSKARTIGRNGIADNELGIPVTYWGEWMSQFKGSNKKFYIRRNPQSYQSAWVFDAETDDFVGMAEAGYWVVDGLAAADVDKAKLKKAITAKKSYEKKLREVVATKPLEAFELVETAKHAISTLYGNSNELPESQKVVDVTPTKAEKTIQKRAEMESEHIREFGDFAIPEIIDDDDFEIFMSETDMNLRNET